MCFILYVCVTYLCVTDMAYMSDIVSVTDMAYMSDIVSVRHSVAQMSEICVSQISCDNPRAHIYLGPRASHQFLLQGQIHSWNQTPTHIPIQNPDMPPRYSTIIH